MLAVYKLELFENSSFTLVLPFDFYGGARSNKVKETSKMATTDSKEKSDTV